MEFKDFLNHILTDTKVKLTEAFDRNFERKAFFDDKWANTLIPNRRGSLYAGQAQCLMPIFKTMAVRWK